MTTLFERIRDDARRRGETTPQGVRHHLLTAIAERLARTGEGSSFVLRGGLLTRAWVAPAPRPTRDLDYVGDFAFDVADTVRRFAPALAVAHADDVVFDPARLQAEGIWLHTAFPGVRMTVALGIGLVDQDVSLDIGFRDPLVPAATWVTTPSGAALRAIRPETQVAWKLHALAEMAASFRPKDLADLWLITKHVALEPAALGPAIVAAFESRAFTLASARDVLEAPHWATKSSRIRWRTQRPTGPELAPILDAVRAYLRPILLELPR